MKKCSHSGKGLTLWVLSKCFLRPWKVHRSVWKFPQTEQGSNLRGQGRGSCLRGQPEADSTITYCPYLLELVYACWQWEMNVFAELISVEDSCNLGLWALSCFSMPAAYSRPSSTKFIYISDVFWSVLNSADPTKSFSVCKSCKLCILTAMPKVIFYHCACRLLPDKINS